MTDRDYTEDARTIAHKFIRQLRNVDAMDMGEILDADLDDTDVEHLDEAIGAVADRLEAALKETGS